MSAFKRITAAFALALSVALAPAHNAAANYKEVCLEFKVVGYAAALWARESNERGDSIGNDILLVSRKPAHTTTCVDPADKGLVPGKRYKFLVGEGIVQAWCAEHSSKEDTHPDFWLMPDGPREGKLVFRGSGVTWSAKCSQTQAELRTHSACRSSYDGMDIPGCAHAVAGDVPEDILHWTIRHDDGLGFLGAYVKKGANPNGAARQTNHFGHGTAPLHVAAWVNRPAYARALIDRAGADVNIRGGDGVTPLHLAVSRGHPVGIVNDLLSRGANGLLTADNGDAPILLAQGAGRNDVVRALANGAAAETLHRIIRNEMGLEMLLAYIRGGMDVDGVAPDGVGFGPGNSALHIAAWLNRADYARALAAEGADANISNGDGLTPVALAVNRGSRETLRTLREAGADLNLPDGNGDTALGIAARANDLRGVQMLLENGAHPDAAGSDGDFPLYIAAREGNAEAVRALIAGGASVHQTHRNGDTAFSVARKNDNANQAVLADLREAGAEGIYPAAAYDVVVERGGAAALRTALREGANVDYADAEGKTALHLAAEGGLREYLAVLTHREFSANVNARDGAGRTPLLAAVAANAADIWGVRALLAKRADPDLADSAGDFPLYIAAENGRHDIARLLASARVNLDACHSEENKTARMRAEELAAEDRGRYWDVYQLLVRRGASEVVANCGSPEIGS